MQKMSLADRRDTISPFFPNFIIMTIYLLNAPILTSYGYWNFTGPLPVVYAKSKIKDGFTSAIGHQASADFLAQLLGVPVPMNRVAITMQAGDKALVLRIKTRLPEGKLLTNEEIKTMPYELGWLVCEENLHPEWEPGISVTQVKPLPDYKLFLEFETGEQRIFDVTPYLEKGVFAQLKDLERFNLAIACYGTVEWPGDIDISPETLYRRSIPV